MHKCSLNIKGQNPYWLFAISHNTLLWTEAMSKYSFNKIMLLECKCKASSTTTNPNWSKPTQKHGSRNPPTATHCAHPSPPPGLLLALPSVWGEGVGQFREAALAGRGDWVIWGRERQINGSCASTLLGFTLHLFHWTPPRNSHGGF